VLTGRYKGNDFIIKSSTEIEKNVKLWSPTPDPPNFQPFGILLKGFFIFKTIFKKKKDF